ncbi:MAG: hypothetical protein AB7U41_02195 [Dongiaceae bacterium]
MTRVSPVRSEPSFPTFAPLAKGGGAFVKALWSGRTPRYRKTAAATGAAALSLGILGGVLHRELGIFSRPLAALDNSAAGIKQGMNELANQPRFFRDTFPDVLIAAEATSSFEWRGHTFLSLRRFSVLQGRPGQPSESLDDPEYVDVIIDKNLLESDPARPHVLIARDPNAVKFIYPSDLVAEMAADTRLDEETLYRELDKLHAKAWGSYIKDRDAKKLSGNFQILVFNPGIFEPEGVAAIDEQGRPCVDNGPDPVLVNDMLRGSGRLARQFGLTDLVPNVAGIKVEMPTNNILRPVWQGKISPWAHDADEQITAANQKQRGGQ